MSMAIPAPYFRGRAGSMFLSVLALLGYANTPKRNCSKTSNSASPPPDTIRQPDSTARETGGHGARSRVRQREAAMKELVFFRGSCGWCSAL
jgi:hypothetical protein